MKRKLSIILVTFWAATLLVSCRFNSNIQQFMNVIKSEEDSPEQETSESQVFWIENPKEELESKMNEIIKQNYAYSDIDAEKKGYLIRNYKVTELTPEAVGREGTLVTAQYGPNGAIILNVELNEKDEIICIYTCVPNPEKKDITTEELYGVYMLLNLTSALHDMKYNDYVERSNLYERILKQEPVADSVSGTVEVSLTEGNCEYLISYSEFLFGFKISDLSKFPTEQSSEEKTESDMEASNEERTESNLVPSTETIAAAGEMFELFLYGQDEATYDDVSCSGSIIVCRETPEEYNNYASYSICGRGFSPIYDTDCIGADEYSWIFKSGGYYYLICPGMDGYYIYYDSSKEKLSQSSECCGIFSLYVSDESVNGENDINIANFEQKVSLSPGNREATDSIMEAYIKEIQESDDPYFFTYEYLGECSDGFYYYNGETNTFNVYRITFEGGYESIYFIPINVEENMIYEFYEYYYELMYRWTQY